MWRNLFILYFVFVKKQRTIERKKKRSKISTLESCYANRIYGTFGAEMRAYGQKLVKFCTQTHSRVNLSSKDEGSTITLTPSQSPNIPSVGPPVLSRERHEASNITLTPSQLPNAAANQLDIF